MNWGNKLVIVFIVFAGLIITLVYKASNAKFDLVSNEYYKDELRYQDKIDGVNNANKISGVSISQEADQLILDLPKEMKGIKSEGEIWMYCATDAGKDKKIPLTVDESGRQLIAKNQLSKGKYQLKLNWVSGGNKYYYEQSLTIN